MKTHLSIILAATVVASFAVRSHSQDFQCQTLRPRSYTYRTDALVNSAVDDDCTEEDIGGTTYTTCTSPNMVLTDSILGPPRFDESDPSMYYLWNKSTMNQILFTFPTDVLVSRVQLHFYTDRDNGTALPKTRLSLVNETFTAADTLNDSIPSFTIDETVGEDGLNNVSRNLTEQFTPQILLRIEEHKVYALALSEIKFCTESSTSTREPSTGSSEEPSLGTTSQQQQSSSDHTTPTSIGQLPTTTTASNRTLPVNAQVTLHSSILSLITLLLFVLLVL